MESHKIHVPNHQPDIYSSCSIWTKFETVKFIEIYVPNHQPVMVDWQQFQADLGGKSVENLRLVAVTTLSMASKSCGASSTQGVNNGLVMG